MDHSANIKQHEVNAGESNGPKELSLQAASESKEEEKSTKERTPSKRSNKDRTPSKRILEPRRDAPVGLFEPVL